MNDQIRVRDTLAFCPPNAQGGVVIYPLEGMDVRTYGEIERSWANGQLVFNAARPVTIDQMKEIIRHIEGMA